MARKLREVAEGALVVLDEPYLCAFGSAFVNVPRNDVIAAIDAGVAAIHKEGALAGLHCCGNTDWSLVFSTDLDVVNFDAYEYFQGLSLYPAELSSFLQKGGVLSWGIVPAFAPTATSTRILCWTRWTSAWNSLPPRAWTAAHSTGRRSSRLPAVSAPRAWKARTA